MDAESIERQERAARNQSLFREVNERLEATRSNPSLFHELICECADPQCSEAILMTSIEYQAVRGHPMRFAVKPGHILSDVERSVGGARGRYVVVEKVERAAEVASHLDPRQRQKPGLRPSLAPTD